MLRRAIGLAALAVPVAFLCAIEGCGDEPLPQDLCSWLSDGNNCYARFAADVGLQCGNEFVAGNDPVASATGYFAARDDLSICVKNAGGQVVFDPPLDLTLFPLESVGFKLLDTKAEECGGAEMKGAHTYKITINPVDANDAGASTAPDGGPLEDHIIGGDFSSSQEAGRERLDVVCPGGTESHNFNALLLDKCSHLASFMPRAIIESSPGTPETQAGPSIPGYVRFRIVYPPTNPEASDAQPRVVEYFNCLIPAPPPPCQDGVRNNDETDIDCGGSCAAKCAEGQSCNVNEDCQSGSCGLNGGFRQCLP